jgi:hypothetical protein
LKRRELHDPQEPCSSYVRPFNSSNRTIPENSGALLPN